MSDDRKVGRVGSFYPKLNAEELAKQYMVKLHQRLKKL